MRMHQIKYFIAVSRHLNFTRAAHECHVSTPSLSRAIRLMEEELGGILVNREGRTTHLTELGRRMLPLLQDGFASVMEAKALAKAIKLGQRKPIVIAVSPSVDSELFSHTLARLQQLYPQLEIRSQRCRADDAFSGLQVGEFDLALAPGFSDSWDRLDRWHLASDTMSVVVNVNHRLALRPSIRSSEIITETIIITPHCDHLPMLNPPVSADRSCGLRHAVSCDEDALSLVEMNLGIALLPASCRIGPKLRRLKIDDVPAISEIYLYAVSGRPRSPVAKKFIELITKKSDAKVASKRDLAGPRPEGLNMVSA